MWIIKIMKPKLSNETFLSSAHRGNLNVELEWRSQTAAKRKRLQIQHFRYHRKLSTAGRKAAKFILSLGQEWARRKTSKQKLSSEMYYPTKISGGKVNLWVDPNEAMVCLPRPLSGWALGDAAMPGHALSLNTIRSLQIKGLQRDPE